MLEPQLMSEAEEEGKDGRREWVILYIELCTCIMNCTTMPLLRGREKKREN